MFTIIAIIKSNYQEKQNWKTVLSKTGQAFMIMLLIPFTVLVGVMLTNTIMSSINQAMQVYPSSGQGTIGGQFLITIGYDAYIGNENQSVIEAMFVSGELNYAKFLEIEKVRFPDTIKYVNNIPDDIGDYLTVKLILQPIAENSIKHGFVGKEGIGTITVSAELDGDDILISVADDGVGFDIPEDFWSRRVDGPNGYGLRNVNERIRLEYGEGYGLTITSQKGVGTTVTARIKKRL